MIRLCRDRGLKRNIFLSLAIGPNKELDQRRILVSKKGLRKGVSLLSSITRSLAFVSSVGQNVLIVRCSLDALSY